VSGPAAGPVLALEASTLRASAALLGPAGEPWGEWQQEQPQIGTAALTAAAGRLLEARGLRVADLLGVAVGLGPGSYTGTRATVAFARGLCFASGVRLAGVPSCAAAARGELRRNAAAQTVIVIVDARRGEACRADYGRGDVVADSLGGSRSEPQLVGASGLPLELLAPRLVSGPEGDPQPPDSSVIVLREPIPAAYDVAAVGRPRLLLGGDPPEVVLPLYLKRSHAEIVFDERAGSQGLGRD
jgi:tRNA threonylcarbamoyladenosine biosynthesis protein TsaB